MVIYYKPNMAILDDDINLLSIMKEFLHKNGCFVSIYDNSNDFKDSCAKRGRRKDLNINDINILEFVKYCRAYTAIVIDFELKKEFDNGIDVSKDLSEFYTILLTGRVMEDKGIEHINSMNISNYVKKGVNSINKILDIAKALNRSDVISEYHIDDDNCLGIVNVINEYSTLLVYKNKIVVDLVVSDDYITETKDVLSDYNYLNKPKKNIFLPSGFDIESNIGIIDNLSSEITEECFIGDKKFFKSRHYINDSILELFKDCNV